MPKSVSNLRLTICVLAAGLALPFAVAQEKSVHPGVNDRFKDPDVDRFISRFEREGRAVYERRDEIIATLELRPGKVVADIGAGTGFFSILMAEKVGPTGKVYAVDISKNFIDHIRNTAKDRDLENIETVLCTPRSTLLEESSIDIAFLCDTYHHFEYPKDTLASIHKALRPGGLLVIVDFERIEGISKEFVLDMVRAGKGTFTDEIIDAGFDFIEEVPFTNEHYVLKFKKRPEKVTKTEP